MDWKEEQDENGTLKCEKVNFLPLLDELGERSLGRDIEKKYVCRFCVSVCIGI